ncbi:autoinducer binding domain-containing protein [Chelativorans sp.]|uniref:helix-turn-helix transcriptional regulator n=1 Tax=Chelativorans sp. TaxID=2203393 RepID=UPI00281212E7|nr:autoinducer binding domain-containing protein [Chelativorans sp.]
MSPSNRQIRKSRHSGRKWRHRLEEVFDFVSTITSCRTEGEVARSFLHSLRSYGVTNLLAGMIPRSGSSNQEQLAHVLLDVWPPQWLLHYFSRGYLFRDPTIRLVQWSNRPFFWREVGELCSVCPVGHRIMNEAREFDLWEGLTFSFPTLNDRAFGVSIASRRLDIPPERVLALQFLSACALGRSLALVNEHLASDDVLLSHRQREAISWASDGLTVGEIAERMDVSRHTADMHLRLARDKLGVKSNIHAVAEALRRGLIS